MSDHTRSYPIWDIPTRLFHWLLVCLVLMLWVSAEKGWMALHVVLGPVCLGLLLFRLVWGVVGSTTARFAEFVKGPQQIIRYLAASRTGTAPHTVGHNPLGALSVLALLGLLGVQAISGLFTSDDIATDGPLVAYVSGKAVSVLSSIHRVGFKLVLVLIALHIAAILFYTLVKRDNLVLPMLTGRKDLPHDPGVKIAPWWLALFLLMMCMAATFAALSLAGH